MLIAAPDPLHEELALACLEAGKPTLCEKPLATSVRGVAADRRCRGRGRSTPDPGRLHAPVRPGVRRAARCRARRGCRRRSRAAHCLHRNAQAHPTATSDGVLVNSMIHEFDSVPWLLDDPLVRGDGLRAPRCPMVRSQDVQIAVLETAGGVVVTVEVSVNAQLRLRHPHARSPAATGPSRSPRRTGCRCAGRTWTVARSSPTSSPASSTPTASSCPPGCRVCGPGRHPRRPRGTVTSPTSRPSPPWSRCTVAGGSRCRARIGRLCTDLLPDPRQVLVPTSA